MAGKHSKSVFDFKKSDCVTASVLTKPHTRISLPFKIIIFVFIISVSYTHLTLPTMAVV